MNESNPSIPPDGSNKATGSGSGDVELVKSLDPPSDAPRLPRILNFSPTSPRVPRQKKRSSSLQKQLQEVLRNSLGQGTQTPNADLPKTETPTIPTGLESDLSLPAAVSEMPSTAGALAEFSPTKTDGEDQGLTEAQPSQQLEFEQPVHHSGRARHSVRAAPSQNLIFPNPVDQVLAEAQPSHGRPSLEMKEPLQIPARMLNEFVYCQRLFFYEFVEGVFVENADTLRGSALHQRVDSGTGAMPKAKGKSEPGKTKGKEKTATSEPTNESNTSPQPPPQCGAQETRQEPRSTDCVEAEVETIHSRSVQMGSERLGVAAKMDLVEVCALRDQDIGQSEESHRTAGQVPSPGASKIGTGETGDLLSVLEVCPVDYKAGAPREGSDANQLWDTDKIQLGLQALILRDNGYTCDEGIIYYRATKQRVRLAITAELESWILRTISEARRIAIGPIPAPLVNSPKCVRCSLAPVCLPDETRLLSITEPPGEIPPPLRPRRLMAQRDDNRALYLNTQGYRVGCSGEVLVVKEKDKTIEEIRIRDVSHVALFGNIQISTQAIQSLCELEIPITYFSMGGRFYGITRGHEMKNVFLRMEQFRLARDPVTCLALARQFVQGKIRNHRTMLMRNHLEPPAPAILRLKRAAEDALQAGSLEELLGIEGAAASQYFQHFNGMIKVLDDLNALNDSPTKAIPNNQLAFNFSFSGRNRRPPTDPVNAMLSLAYSLLSKDCTMAVAAVGFDPYVGFYHQPRFGRPAMGLDLMEEFRPLIAESTVLSCINNRVITEKDFVRAGQAVNLSAPGRKRFFQVYEQRMTSLLTHPLFDYKVSYRRALELQARLLAKALTGEIAEYVPLLTR